jgi:hypothetical protein
MKGGRMAETKDAPKVASNVKPVDNEGWETVVEPYGETYSFETPGDTLIGTYSGNKEVSTEDLNNPGEMRDQTVYEITDQNEKKWSVWSAFNIDAALADLPIGSMVKITFDGKVPIDNGKRTVKQFTIAVKRT